MQKHLPFMVFCVLFFILGLYIYRDYGVPWDEGYTMTIGERNFKYVTKGAPALLTFSDRYYGALFETSIWGFMEPLPYRDKVLNRHLAVFLVFVMGLVALYILAYRLFRSVGWSLLSAVLLVLSPRIFADAFYNTKDIPFLAFFTLAALSVVCLLDVAWSARQWPIKLATAVFGAICCACAIDIRMPGIVFIPLAGILLMLIIVCRPGRWKDVSVMVAVWLVITAGLIILFEPIYWHDPVREFLNGFAIWSHFTWDRTMLYRGQYVSAMQPLWHYIPTWILISTPLLQLSGLVLGIFSLAWRAGRWTKGKLASPVRSLLDGLTADTLAWLAIVGWLVVPLAVVILFRSVFYDGWRQMYFIYPAILLVAVLGMKTVYERLSVLLKRPIWLKMVAGAILMAGLAEPLVFCIQYHPHENVFFNVFAGDPATLRQNYEQDYWGLSYKQGIDYILAHDPSDKIKVAVIDPPGQDYVKWMPEQASRLVMASADDSDYLVTTFRWHPADYTFGDEVYSINIRGTKILAVYKKK
jgi:hypothetical protein